MSSQLHRIRMGRLPANEEAIQLEPFPPFFYSDDDVSYPEVGSELYFELYDNILRPQFSRDGRDPDIAVQWYHDDDPTPLDGQTSEYFLVGAGDLGKRLRAVMTYTDPGGFAPVVQVSPAIGPVLGGVNPVVTGGSALLVVGETRTLTTPPTFLGVGDVTISYQWYRLNSSSERTDIPGATGTSYVLAVADLGCNVILRVTAVGQFGTYVRFSNFGTQVQPA